MKLIYYCSNRDVLRVDVRWGPNHLYVPNYVLVHHIIRILRTEYSIKL